MTIINGDQWNEFSTRDQGSTTSLLFLFSTERHTGTAKRKSPDADTHKVKLEKLRGKLVVGVRNKSAGDCRTDDAAGLAPTNV